MEKETQTQVVTTSTVPNEVTDQSALNVRNNPGFFQEDNGTYSSMRLMCFLSLFAAITFGLLTILLNANGKSDGGNGIYITFGFLIGAFAPKAVQKFAEQKIPQIGQK